MSKTFRRADRHDDELFWEEHERHSKQKDFAKREKKKSRKKVEWSGSKWD